MEFVGLRIRQTAFKEVENCLISFWVLAWTLWAKGGRVCGQGL